MSRWIRAAGFLGYGMVSEGQLGVFVPVEELHVVQLAANAQVHSSPKT